MIELGPDTDIAAVVRWAQRRGQEVVVVPGRPGRAATIGAFAQKLRFPDYFGGTLDGFEECLADEAANRQAPWSLIWDGAVDLRQDDPATHRSLLDILRQTAQDHPHLEVIIIER